MDKFKVGTVNDLSNNHPLKMYSIYASNIETKTKDVSTFDGFD